MNVLEKHLQKIEKVLDKAWRDPDEAAIWHMYGFSVENVQLFIDIGVVDPHTAQALHKLGLRPGLIDRTRKKLKDELEAKSGEEDEDPEK